VPSFLRDSWQITQDEKVTTQQHKKQQPQEEEEEEKEEEEEHRPTTKRGMTIQRSKNGSSEKISEKIDSADSRFIELVVSDLSANFSAHDALPACPAPLTLPSYPHSAL